MKRKIILVPMIVILLLVSVAPVMAAPKGLKVAASITMTHVVSIVPGTERPTEGGIQQIRGELDVFGNLLVIGSNSYDVYSSNIADSSWNMKTGVKITHSDAVWYIPADGSPNGFSGNVEEKFYDWAIDPVTHHPTFSIESIHCVMHGFGDFAGQTLMLSYEGSNSHEPWTGYCLKG